MKENKRSEEYLYYLASIRDICSDMLIEMRATRALLEETRALLEEVCKELLRCRTLPADQNAAAGEECDADRPSHARCLYQ